jgi:quercetin dioxygenase-like cupin family protein
MSTTAATLYGWEGIELEPLNAGLSRRVIVSERMTMAQIHLSKGAVVPLHSHENEQLAYILEGALRFWLGEDGSETVDVAAGEVLVIPPNVPHRVEALEDTLDLDVFAPPRADWIAGTDSYLRG